MRLSISKAFAYGGYIILAGMLVSLLASTVALERLKIGGAAYDRIITGKDLVADILPPPAYVIESFLESHVIARDPAAAAGHLERLRQLRSEYQTRREFWAKSDILPEDLKEVVTRSDLEVQRFWSAIDGRLAPAAHAADPAAISSAMTELSGAYQAHRAIIDELVAKANAYSATSEASASREALIFRVLMFGSSALVFALVWGAIRYLRSRSSDRLGVLSKYLEKLGAGNFSDAVPYRNDEDEIGVLARAVNMFRSNLGEQEAERTRREDEERRQMEERLQSEARAIESERQLVSASIGAGLAELSSRNLTYRLTQTLPEGYRKLQADFNSSIGTFENALGAVKIGVENISPGAAHIAASAGDLARQAEQQAAGVDRASGALKEITNSAQKIAAGAGEAKTIVCTTRTEAEESGQVVREAVDAITRIEKSSQSIGQIIGVVDEIAFQTNLLALNAGVEAARAGEAGRGFAVVASEVRALAQRSAEAAKEIKSLISTSSAEVDQGVELVGRTGHALEKIVAQVVELEAAVSNITARALEQATSLEDIQSVVHQIDRNTQTNAAMAEETMRASNALQQEAKDLASMVAGFRVGRSQPPTAAAAAPASKSPATVVSLRSPSRGGGAVAQKTDDWEEF
ncbi:methyl-accepting chemotaxis protein [Methylocystis echinoides]|uniref:Methyl-accepting chemotaxis protein n=1 Tax=Methylocystis echinoides TaxID=29468 RepID=A0A9W6LRH9_9HYPH|nr:methyl-accepting chemotaxis protein [Methylocystis echinoides]GLI92482.1 methyl-accepting chemotaxis protein [Methylocystis echinoides]